MNHRKFDTKLVAQIGVMLALATVLKLFKIYQMPQGGSVTMGSMVPILVMAYLHGPRVGMITGFLFGMVTMVQEPYFLHPVQILLDYPLPFMALGLAGYFPNRILLGTVVAIGGRFFCHFLSGVVFFASYAPQGMSPYVYSFLFNASYLGPELIISVVLLKLLPLARLKAKLSIPA
ncbi:thiamine transporter thit [Lucifera butyrica]|uniref:Thiamine transporter thit n=1 Tax=Lucifera butyrica TaxID=1351585 RepID=A0A498R631_9FIRM|nr:energy-coupled thiamine transporter ThiT [Lucifera butyrica]VBB08196.1 thiamine transporter thit [Lucifera butyrica]